MSILQEALLPTSSIIAGLDITVSLFSWALLLVQIFFWRKNKKTRAARTLFLVILSYTITMTINSAGFLHAFVNQHKTTFHNVSLYLTYFFITVSYTVLVYFSKMIFSLESKYTKKYFIFLGLLSILVLLPNNYYGLPPDQQIGWGPNIRPFTMASVLVVLSTINIRIIRQSMKFYKKIQVNHVKIGILCFMLAQIAELINFLGISIDTFLIFLVLQYTGYSTIFIIGFFFNSLYPVLMFLSQALPIWIWRRLKQKTPFSPFFDKNRMFAKVDSTTLVDHTHPKEEIIVTCPICQINKYLSLSPMMVEQIRNKSNGMSTVFVEENNVCEHAFVTFVDQFLVPRGYQTFDAQIEIPPNRS